MPDIIDLENDLLSPRLSVRIQGRELVLDYANYTLEWEIRYAEWQKGEADAIAAGKLLESRMELLGLVASVVTPTNPEYTRERLKACFSGVAMARLLRFFERLPLAAAAQADRAEQASSTTETTPTTPDAPAATTAAAAMSAA